MKTDGPISHEFVEFIPKKMAASTVYVSMQFATASHLCFCGCGSEVVTPLSPAGWQIWFDGEVISLSPSVGSWSLPCQSHYWVKDGEVRWAGSMTKQQIAMVRHRDRLDNERHFSGDAFGEEVSQPKVEVTPVERKARKNLWQRLVGYFQ